MTAYALPAYTGPGSPQTPVPVPDPEPAPPAPAADLLQRGRYAISGMPDGSWVIARAAPICERCESCGCGQQQDVISVPAMIVNLLDMAPEDRAKLNPLALMRRLMADGR